jgi:RNA polymerase sigma factor (sigma-70 family)
MAKEKGRLAEVLETARTGFLNYIRSKIPFSDTMDAEDVLHDVVAGVLGRDLGEIEDASAYLFSAIRNRVIDSYRKRGKKEISLQDVIDPESGHALEDRVPDSRYDVQSEAERAELRAEIWEAVECLPPPQKAVWIATEIEGRSFTELSEEWEEPVNTLLSRKHRAVGTLRRSLEHLSPLFLS